MSPVPDQRRLILLPAVDVVEGRAVRLVQGKAGSETEYGSALDAALTWQRDGAEWIHLVDLDAAFGRGSNRELLAEVLKEGLRMTVSEAARQLGVTRQQLHRVLARHSAVTPAMALRLGRLCGNGPRLWLAMQADWDLAHAREQLGEALERVPEYRGG